MFYIFPWAHHKLINKSALEPWLLRVLYYSTVRTSHTFFKVYFQGLFFLIVKSIVVHVFASFELVSLQSEFVVLF